MARGVYVIGEGELITRWFSTSYAGAGRELLARWYSTTYDFRLSNTKKPTLSGGLVLLVLETCGPEDFGTVYSKDILPCALVASYDASTVLSPEAHHLRVELIAPTVGISEIFVACICHFLFVHDSLL